MKIVWLCNIPIPRAAKAFGLKVNPIEGWLISVSNELERHEDIELSIVFPISSIQENYLIKRDGRIDFVGFNCKKNSNEEHTSIFAEIIKRLAPDVIHIWGTENEHSYYMTEAAKQAGIINRVVVSIQGLVSMYEMHYFAGIPGKVQIKPSFRDIIRHDSLQQQYSNFQRRGEIEKKTIKNAQHVIGRTFWDKACVELINPKCEYHFNNETLRSSFYNTTWSVTDCIKHRVFVSQAQYPIKGFHYLIKAVSMIKDKYPDITVHVSGNDNSFKDGIYATAYGKYLQKEIEKYSLKNSVRYIGLLDEKDMIKEFLEAEVFVSPSVIENSPNSVGEAMLLGMPVISSNVGGVSDMLVHNQDGFLYQSDAPYMLAYYIDRFFSDAELKVKLGTNAHKHANVTHCVETNLNGLLDIYRYIA